MRKQRAFELHCQFYTQGEIAKELKVSQPTIGRWLAEANQAIWATEENMVRADQFRLKSLFRIDKIVREAELAFRRSQQPVVTIIERQIVGKDGKLVLDADGKPMVRIEKITRSQAGDAQFQRVMLDGIAKGCELLGVHRPAVEGDGDDGPPKTVEELMEEIFAVPSVKKLAERAIEAEVSGGAGGRIDQSSSNETSEQHGEGSTSNGNSNGFHHLNGHHNAPIDVDPIDPSQFPEDDSGPDNNVGPGKSNSAPGPS